MFVFIVIYKENEVSDQVPEFAPSAAALYGSRQNPFSVNTVWGMTPARDPKQVFFYRGWEPPEGTPKAYS